MAFLKHGQRVMNALTGANQNEGWIVPKRNQGLSGRTVLNFAGDTYIDGISYLVSPIVQTLINILVVPVATTATYRQPWTIKQHDTKIWTAATTGFYSGRAFNGANVEGTAVDVGEVNKLSLTLDGGGFNTGFFSLLKDEDLQGIDNYGATAPSATLVIGGDPSIPANHWIGVAANMEIRENGILVRSWRIDDDVGDLGQITESVVGDHGVLHLGAGFWSEYP